MRQIVEYLLQHPTARDTASGIGLWWLGRRFSPATVEAGLEELALRGMIEIHDPAPGNRTYGFNAEAALDARAFAAGEDLPWRT